MTRKVWIFACMAFIVSLAIAFFVSPFASQSPDGLESVAHEKGFLAKSEETEPLWKFSPMPDYAMPGVENEGLSTGLAGIIGTVLIFGLGLGVAFVLTVRKRKESVPR